MAAESTAKGSTVELVELVELDVGVLDVDMLVELKLVDELDVETLDV